MASLHKVVIIGVLCVSYQMLAQEPGSAKNDSDTALIKMELEEVESVGELPGELESVSLKPLLVVHKQDIRSAPASSPEDLLESLPQLDVRHRGKHGIQSDLSIQGGTFDQSMVLLNGIDLSDPQTGHFHLNVPVDLSAINSVEVATGAATRHYGTSAFSGAVNLVTRPLDSTAIGGRMSYGQYGYYDAGLQANIGGKQLSVLTSLSTSGSAGYRENTDFRSGKGYIHAISEKENFRIHLMAGLNSRAFGANAFYSPRFIHQYEEGTTGMAALKALVLKRKIKYSFAAYGRFNRDYFLLDRYDPDFYHNHHRSRVAGAKAGLELSSGAGITRSGIHYRSEGIRSTSLGEPLQTAEAIPYNDSLLFTHGHLRSHINWNLNHRIQTGPFTVSGGFLLHFNSDLDFEPRIYPGIDLRMQLPASLQVYASYNRSMRLPTFTDLYYKGPSNVGNPDLKPEKASLYEFGLYRDDGALHVDLNTFFREGKDLIDWIWMEDEKWHTMNLTQVNAAGLSLSAGYRNLKQNHRIIYLASADASYSFTHLNKAGDGLNSRYVLDPLRHKVVLAAGLQFAGNFRLYGRFTAQDRDGTYLAFDPSTGDSFENSYTPFALVDLKLTYSFRIFHLNLEANNLFDQEYNDIGNVIQPGRWIILGLQVN